MNEYTEQVKRGTDLLDTERPGWRDEIDLSTLDLGSSYHCILGQVFGTYYDGLYALWQIDPDIFDNYDEWIDSPNFQTAIAHGFSINNYLDIERSNDEQALQKAWIAELDGSASRPKDGFPLQLEPGQESRV